MNCARLLLFEDSADARDEVRYRLRETNHLIVAEAWTLERALRLVKSTLPYDVVLLDANLDHPERNGRDAHIIWSALGKLPVRPPVIGISTNELQDYGLSIPSQLDLTKDRIALLPQILETLPQPA